MTQDQIVFSIVALAIIHLGFRFFKSFVANLLSHFLLKLGYVKMAMSMRRAISSKSNCANCSC